MTQILPRFLRHQTDHADQQKLDRIIADATDNTLPATVTRATLPGDTRRLRGIPICALGVRGTSPGTDPLGAVLRRLGA